MKKIFFSAALLLLFLPLAISADADINDDGVIDLSDLILVTTYFGKTTGYDREADTDINGIIDIYDVVYVASRVGTEIPTEVSYWPFDGNAYDSSGNNDCVLYGSPVFEAGISGQGLKLDGTDDYADCGNDASLEIGTSDWTITAWIKLETTQPTWTGIIEKGGTTLTTEGYWLSYYLTNGDLRLYISDGTTREYLDSNDNLNLNDGAWHHIAAVYDRNDKAYFYLDGTGIGSYPTSFNNADITNPSRPLKIGYNTNPKGTIDEVKIFRKALTQQEIRTLIGNCPGTCKTNTCNNYNDCTTSSGSCATGYCCAGTCFAPTNQIYAASLSPADIQSAADAAKDGDTIVLPAGDYYEFNKTVYIKNGVSMRGQGKGTTKIHASSAFTGNMLIWNNERKTSDRRVEIKDFSLYGPGAGKDASAVHYVGIRLNNAYQMLDFIVHNFHGEQFSTAAILIWGVQYGSDVTQTRIVRGLIYNSSFKEVYSTPAGVGYGVSLQGDNWIESEGNEQPLGSADSIFVEDCTFDHCRHGFASGRGSIQVVRYCTFTHPYTQPTGYTQHLLDAHGTRSGDKTTQAYEYYHNTLDGTGALGEAKGIGLRGGHGVVWENTFINTPQWIRLNADDTTEDSDLYFLHDLYIWGNTVDGNPQPSDAPFNGFPEYIKKNEDYFMYQLAGYTPYPYPHPLRSS